MKKLLSFFVALLLCTDFISGQSAKSDSLFHVGVKQYCDQKYELAIKTFEMIEKIDVKDFGTDYYRLFYAKWWKASSYYNLGDTVSAKSISDYYDIEPIDRSITGLSDSLRYLAQFYYDSNDYINAITCMEKCLAIEEQEFINTFFPLSTINKLLSFFINEKNNLQDSVILSLFERGHKLLKPLIHNKGKIEIQTRYDFYLT